MQAAMTNVFKTESNEQPLNSLLRVASDTISAFPGKHEALAAHLKKSPHYLLNEVNPSNQAKFGLIEAVRLMQVTGDYSLLHAISDALGHSCLRIEDHSQASDTEILEIYACMHAKVGGLAMEVAGAFEDHKILASEVDLVRSAGLDMVRAFYAFLDRLEAVSQP